MDRFRVGEYVRNNDERLTHCPLKSSQVKGQRPNKRHKRHKSQEPTIHDPPCVRPEELPEGSRFKGYEDYTVQDIRIELHNNKNVGCSARTY